MNRTVEVLQCAALNAPAPCAVCPAGTEPPQGTAGPAVIPASYPAVWNGTRDDERSLAEAVCLALGRAAALGFDTAALPLPGGGCPTQTGAQILVHTALLYAQEHPEAPVRVLLCVPGETRAEVCRFECSRILARGEVRNYGVGAGQYVFFCREDQANGCLSNWYRAPFTLEGLTWQSAEQYMMAKKALVFGDLEIYAAVRAEEDPHACKALGRRVRGFDGAAWDACSSEIVYNAVRAKFAQNAPLRAALLETGDRTLCEANPDDPVWGIGLAADDPRACSRELWPGENRLGDILARVRGELG